MTKSPMRSRCRSRTPLVSFQIFGPTHLAALAAIALAAAALAALLARRPALRGPARWLLFFLVLGHAVSAYWQRWPHWSWAETLPLHLCNFVLILLAVALVRPSARLGEIVYYWGLGGALPALLTPDLRDDFPSSWFNIFFVGHGVLVLAVVTVLAAADLRPGPGSARRAWLGLLVYVVVLGLLDAVTGWNYGYLMRPPTGRTLVDHFGPWPWYVAVTLLVAGGLFALLQGAAVLVSRAMGQGRN